MTEVTLIASLDTPSSGVFTLSGLSLSGYREVTFEAIDIRVTTDGTDPRLTLFVSASEIVTNYSGALEAISSGNSSNPDSFTSQVGLLLTGNDASWDQGNAATKAFSATAVCDNPGASGRIKRIKYHSLCVGPTGNIISNAGIAWSTSTGAIDGFKLGGTSSLTAGFVRLWGLPV